MSRYTVLAENEISDRIAKLSDWSVKDGNIQASFEFAGFKEAIGFIMQVAILAEKVDHHPEFENSYNKVRFSYCTHDAGFKLTDVDFDVAESISDIASAMGVKA